MAAVAYRNRSAARVVIMDDSWAHTDRSSAVVRRVKRLIHASVDGAFVPTPHYATYYASLGFARDRLVYGVDAVDTARFADEARRARAAAGARTAPYFLFVGRFLPGKGLGHLLDAYRDYRSRAAEPWELRLVGGGAADLPPGCLLPPGAHAVGARFGHELCAEYALAGALVMPSESDTWGLVVSEAMASGTPVAVSSGCGCACVIEHGVNGWSFPVRDRGRLTALMTTVAALPAEERGRIGAAGSATIGGWGLDRFADGVFAGAALPRARPAGPISRIAAARWKGRVRVY
jgi:glycosyltransferase involved in cell wall biosynthesis